jgi:hypothetical protein
VQQNSGLIARQTSCTVLETRGHHRDNILGVKRESAGLQGVTGKAVEQWKGL